MLLETKSRNPELDTVALELPESGIILRTWESYVFESDYLTPSDGFHFQIGNDLTDRELDALSIGAPVVLKVNDAIQATGFIDDVDIWNDRNSGTKISIVGRDRLGYAVDSGIDPRLQIKEGWTLSDVLLSVFLPFGFEKFDISNDDNRNILRGSKRGTKTTKKGKPLKNFVLHQLKPYPNEGAFQFAARISQRHGLWIRPTADGLGLVVAKPNFEQAPSYRLQRKRNGGIRNNILTGNVKRSGTDQPSVIFASGFGGGGEFARSTLRGAVINPSIRVEVDTLSKLLDGWPKVELYGTDFPAPPFRSKRARPVYLHDDESKTQEQLENYLRRELSLRLRKALVAEYSVAGHTYGDLVWAVDTIVDVDDDVGRLHEPMWIARRSFYMARGSGTLTSLSLIRPHSLVF